MNKIFHGILIDPIDRECSVVKIDADNILQSLYDHIECDMMELCAHQPNGDVIYVDEEGLFKEGLRSFQVLGVHQPFFGRGLILGRNLTAPRLPYITWINKISFSPQFEVGSVTPVKEAVL